MQQAESNFNENFGSPETGASKIFSQTVTNPFTSQNNAVTGNKQVLLAENIRLKQMLNKKLQTKAMEERD